MKFEQKNPTYNNNVIMYSSYLFTGFIRQRDDPKEQCETKIIARLKLRPHLVYSELLANRIHKEYGRF